MGQLRVIDPRAAAEDEDVVGIGDDLSPETLLWAYRQGIFPWPMDDLPLLWFCPPQRAVLEFKNLKIPDRLAREKRNCGLSFTIDHAFDRVIAACRHIARPGQEGTWITEEMVAAYTELHRRGNVHSVEAWDTAGALAGGLYGVAVDGLFSGESMFHLVPNASKLAFLYLADHLRSRGADWLDIQTMTPHFAALGATFIPRNDFLDRLDTVHARNLQLFD
ncbi:MAG TPA: leucyl/phenylalanyl-tRNA--protein transferase [Capsulimonadaceae bacterium]|nr:leucyl/phenylalanyl-tRNA--protein transferase [Capsulimonadaceae bacterium]